MSFNIIVFCLYIAQLSIEEPFFTWNANKPLLLLLRGMLINLYYYCYYYYCYSAVNVFVCNMVKTGEC